MIDPDRSGPDRSGPDRIGPYPPGPYPLGPALAGGPDSPRAAAFGPEPGPPPPGRTDALDRWLGAVALGAAGRYAAAWAELARLLADPAVPRPVAAHAAITRASHLRQMGGHAAARRYDALGLRLAAVPSGRPVRPGPPGIDRAATDPSGLNAEGTDRPDIDGTGWAAARVDALIGLAADAVGLADLGTAQRLLGAVGAEAQGHPSWRPRVRWGWVRAELALAQGRPQDAVGPAAAALSAATAAGSRRHELKSRILLAVARGAAGADAESVAAELEAVGEECARRGLLPLCWPAALAGADVLTRNDAPGRPARRALSNPMSDATRRRHAARAALSVLYSRTDPVGKGQMGESFRPLLGSTIL